MALDEHDDLSIHRIEDVSTRLTTSVIQAAQHTSSPNSGSSRMKNRTRLIIGGSLTLLLLGFLWAVHKAGQSFDEDYLGI